MGRAAMLHGGRAPPGVVVSSAAWRRLDEFVGSVGARGVTAGSGSYANAGCTTSGGKQDYEWEPGASASGFTLGLSSGVASIETVGGARLACTGASGAGNYVGSKQIGGLVLTLSGCERDGMTCASAGAPAGEIVSSALEGVLGVEKLGASTSKDKLGVELFPVGHAGSLTEFSCGGETVSLRGSAIAPVKSNEMATTPTMRFKASRGRQKPAGLLGEAADPLEASFNGAPFEQAGLTLAGAASGEQGLEMNSVE